MSFLFVLFYYLNALLLFLVGILGIIINKKNVIILLMSLELMLLGINMSFITSSIYLDDLIGQIFPLFIITIAAAESAIGLAILITFYRIRGTISADLISLLKN